jgi:apolipoprotein D and lipocalin family protein
VSLPAIDPAAYLGRWFELARTPNFFQDNQPSFFGETYSRCLDTEVTYTRSAFDWVALRNSCTRVGQTTGFTYEEAIEGIAVPVAGTNTSQLLIGFGPLPFSLFPILFGFGGDYWIYAVGPVVDGQYQWALVSGPDPASDPFFVLTRQQQVSPQVRAEILSTARDNGLPVERLVFNRE